MAAVATRRARKAVLSVTESAANRIRELIAGHKDADPVKGIRIGVKKRGCTGLSYTMNYVHDKDVNKLDDIVSSHGVNVFVDPKAVMHIVGTTMDFKEDELGAEFVFKNPNESAKCGCGESFMTQPKTPAAAAVTAAAPASANALPSQPRAAFHTAAAALKSAGRVPRGLAQAGAWPLRPLSFTRGTAPTAPIATAPTAAAPGASTASRLHTCIGVSCCSSNATAAATAPLRTAAEAAPVFVSVGAAGGAVARVVVAEAAPHPKHSHF